MNIQQQVHTKTFAIKTLWYLSTIPGCLSTYFPIKLRAASRTEIEVWDKDRLTKFSSAVSLRSSGSVSTTIAMLFIAVLWTWILESLNAQKIYWSEKQVQFLSYKSKDNWQLRCNTSQIIIFQFQLKLQHL